MHRTEHAAQHQRGGQVEHAAHQETFEYTSGCPLPAVGTMRGTYHCVGENGIPFEVPIQFVLAMPRTLH